MKQPSLFDIGAEPNAPTVVPSKPAVAAEGSDRPSTCMASQPGLGDPGLTGSVMDQRQQMVEQIMRDIETLRMGPDYWVPSKQFYEERIRSYKEAL